MPRKDPAERRAAAREYLRTHPEQREKANVRARAAMAAKRAADPGHQHRAAFYDELEAVK